MLDLIINVVFPSLLSALGWGIAPYFDKKALELLDNNYAFALCIKFIFIGLAALLILFAINSKFKVMYKTKKSRKAFGVLMLSALFIVGANYYFLKALSNTKYITLVVLIAYIIPIIITALMSYMLLHETINIGMIIGLIICIIGIIIFVCHSKNA
jgi:uncharacterized membrane protein